MKRRNIIFSVILALLGAALVLGGARRARAALPLAPAAPQGDQFGYQLAISTITQTGWISANVPSGIQVALNSVDDGLSSLINLPFSFPFYENSYSGLRVDSNGLVHFSSDISLAANQRIPSVTIPNDFAAAFWDDLYVGATQDFTGKVYYLAGGSQPNRYVVIEWLDASRLTDSSHPLTFEMVLHENGDIAYLYRRMTGDLTNATVGIEDSDGLDGLEFVHNQPGVASGLALVFRRPRSVQYGVRSLTPFNSDLIVGRAGKATFSFRNTGQNSGDTYEFQVAQPANWAVQLSSAGGGPLVDANQDGKLETQAIGHDGSFTVTLSATSPAGLPQGAFVSIPITVTSVASPTHHAYSLARFAIPANFVYSFTDLDDNNRLGFISPDVSTEPTLNASFGRDLAVAVTPANTYFYAWNRDYTPLSGKVTNIEFAIFNGQGKVMKYITTPKDNTLPGSGNLDVTPGVAAAPNGNVGLLFLRHQSDGVDNIRFVLLNSDGTLLTDVDAQGNLTGQVTNALQFSDPRLVVTSDGNFVASWTANNSQTSASNIWLAALNSDTGAVIRQAQFTNSTDGNHYFDSAMLASLSGARVLLTYQESEQVAGNPVMTTRLVALDSTGVPVPGSGLALAGLSTAQRAATQFSLDGPILFAWTGGSTEQVSYVVVNNAVTSAGVLFNLPQPDYLGVGNLSVSSDHTGRSIVLWQDFSLFRRLYYALLNADGSLATPTVILKDSGPGKILGASTTGQGLANFEGFYLQFLSVLLRR